MTTLDRAARVVAVGVLTAGCGTSTPASAPAVLPSSASIRVGLADFAVRLPAVRAAAGRVVLDVTNAGSTAHDLLASQGGETLGHTPVLGPGASAVLVVTVRAGGSVRLVCTLPGHERAGMHNRLEVAA